MDVSLGTANISHTLGAMGGIIAPTSRVNNKPDSSEDDPYAWVDTIDIAPDKGVRWRRTEDSKRRRNAVKRRVRALNVRVRMLETMPLQYLAAYASLYALNFTPREPSLGAVFYSNLSLVATVVEPRGACNVINDNSAIKSVTRLLKASYPRPNARMDSTSPAPLVRATLVSCRRCVTAAAVAVSVSGAMYAGTWMGTSRLVTLVGARRFSCLRAAVNLGLTVAQRATTAIQPFSTCTRALFHALIAMSAFSSHARPDRH